MSLDNLDLEIFEHYVLGGIEYYVEVFREGDLFTAFASKKFSNPDFVEIVGKGTDLENQANAIKNAIINLEQQFM
ncbi:hypothetical protein [Peribacillus glennii]|uniref:Uncharacterized protein n=1 Tax=Peribacillus glennii TaxID=2303991 RepID=A0A372L6S2_9BACI|nr:hypothetical protein [Peribacillus glennii]RFU60790.1 hypothetical protein D0466_20790 [Peribacillus glennii]